MSRKLWHTRTLAREPDTSDPPTLVHGYMLSQEEAAQLCLSLPLHGRFAHQLLLAPHFGLAKFFEFMPAEPHMADAAALATQVTNATPVATGEWVFVRDALAACDTSKRGPEPLAIRAAVALVNSFILTQKADEAITSLQLSVALYLLAHEARAKQQGNRIGLAFHTAQLKKQGLANANKFIRSLFNSVTDWYRQP